MASVFFNPTSQESSTGTWNTTSGTVSNSWGLIDEGIATYNDSDNIYHFSNTPSSIVYRLSGTTPVNQDGGFVRIRCGCYLYGTAYSAYPGQLIKVIIGGVQYINQQVPSGLVTITASISKAQVAAWNLSTLDLTIDSTSNPGGIVTVSVLEIEILQADPSGLPLYHLLNLM